MVQKCALVFALVSGVTLSGQRPDPVAPASVLPVTRVVLYKTGVGLFEHLATVTGNQSLAVQFTGDQLDDVLQSLTAVDLGDGRVSGINYDSPTSTERRLQALRLPLGQKATTLQLLEALRGSRVEVRSAAGVVAVGRLLSVERRAAQRGLAQAAAEQPGAVRPAMPTPDRDAVTLVTDQGAIRTLELTGSTHVRIVDDELRQEVARYMAIAESSSERSPRRVVLSTAGVGTRQLFVSYVSQSAVWKSTYRLVFPDASSPRPMLQGWAIVDNVSGADWDNVDLSLVAGAPQTFRQPLSVPLFVARPTISLNSAAPPAPVTFSAPLVTGTNLLTGVVREMSGANLPGASVEVSGGTLNGAVRTAITDSGGRYQVGNLPAGTFRVTASFPGFVSAVLDSVSLQASGAVTRDFILRIGGLEESITVTGAARPSAARTAQLGGEGVRPRAAPVAAPSQAVVEARVLDQASAAIGEELGELFEYRLRDRVTIRRNQSALVPILNQAVKAERVSVWNQSMGPRPRRAVWLTNSSDLTLDGGSLGIYDEGAFAGEGLIDTVKPGERRLVSYASDLGVQVSPRADASPRRAMRVRILRGVVMHDYEERQQRSYVIRNDNRESRQVVVEHPIRSGWTLVDMSAEESTAGVHRFRVTVPAGQTVTFVVTESLRGVDTFALSDLHQERLQTIVTAERRMRLDAAMQPIYAKSQEIDEVEARIANVAEQANQIGEEQERLRENMETLKGTKAERRLLQRYVAQLDAQETQLERLRSEGAGLEAQQARLEKELTALLDALAVDVSF